MRFLAFVILIFSNLPILASQWPEPLSRGIYSMGDIQVLSKKHSITVHKSRDKKRYEDLRESGYACVHAQQNNFQCTKFLSTWDAENEIREGVVSEYGHQLLTVEDLRSPIELISEAEALSEWRVNQKVIFNKIEFLDYRLLETMSGNKIFLGEPSEFSFVLDQDNKPSLSVFFSKSEKKNGHFSYLVLIHYKK